MGEPEAKAAARAAIKAGMDAAFGGGEAKYDGFAASMEQAFWDAFDAAGGGGGGGTKKILYGAQYSSTNGNANADSYSYWVSFFDYSYFYNSTNSYEITRNMPIPGPGNVVRVFTRTGTNAYTNTKTQPTDFQLRSNGADVAGASFSVPAGAPADTIYDVTGSWPFSDGDEMCLRVTTGSAGNCYIKSVGLIVEV